MAANMIGYRKRIIIVSMGFMDVVMVNPVIVSKAQPYDTEEGCLSLDGVRKKRAVFLWMVLDLVPGIKR